MNRSPGKYSFRQILFPGALRAAILEIPVLLLLSYCQPPQGIQVSAASSLTESLEEIARLYQKDTRSAVFLNFAGSGHLLRQIQAGAPVDLLASADDRTIQMAIEQRIIHPDNIHEFAGNELVMIVPANAHAPSSLNALLEPSIRRIAMGDPLVPAGRYARQVLISENLAIALESKLVYASNVRQVLSYVKRGEVDAGFVYSSDAMLASDDVQIAFTLQTETPVRYMIGILNRSAQMEQGKQFMRYLIENEGARHILERRGFVRPTEVE